MRVKSIVLDGFKSYAHRQELADLDKHFNAITGFNGSGKSNIFDAICFVMGISNLKKVRADDTRDLIYRAGAAGVQSARVTIEFLNDDPKTAPQGYPPSDFPIITVGRQTQIGGKQRYFFMNRQSDQSKIKHFFQNINLNVDNPHFMVLQGTVHKLIGMKSSDILALVEEAVGTKVFDVRRRTAENLIRGKEKKLEEINRNLTHEIGPMLEAMRADQLEYDTFLKASENLEGKRKFRIAFQFWNQKELLEKSSQIKSQLEEEVGTSRTTLQSIPALVAAAQQSIASLTEKLKEPEESYTKFHEKESHCKKEIQRINIQIQSSEKTLADLGKQQKEFAKDQADLVKRQAALKKLQEQRKVLHTELTMCEEQMEKLRDSLRLHRSGIQAGANGVSLEEERSNINNQLIRLKGEARRNGDRMKHLKESIASLKQKSANDASKTKQMQDQLEKVRKSLQDASAQYQPFEESERRLSEIQKELQELHREGQRLQQEVTQGGDPTLQLALHYDPVAGVNLEKSIFGRLGELVHPKDPKYTLALSTGAQQHLMKVVISDDTVAQALIERGNLRQRTSFMPLNKMTPPRLDPRRVEEAVRRAQEAKGFACIASQLVNYDSAFAGAVESAFGGFIVCSNMALAQVIAFDKMIGLKAVTLEGESADPQGLMSGGSHIEGPDLLSRIHQQARRSAPLQAITKRISSLNTEREQVATKLGQGGHIRKNIEDLEVRRLDCERHLLEAQGDVGDQISREEQELNTLEQKLLDNNALETQLTERKEELSKHEVMDPKKVEAEFNAKLKEVTARHGQLRTQLDGSQQEFDNKEADVEQREQDAGARGKELEKDLESQKQSLADLKQHKQRMDEDVLAIQEERKQCDSLRVALDKEKEDAEAEVASLRNRQDALERTIKEKEGELKQLGKGLDDHRKHLHEMERRYAWIKDEKHLFGPADGQYYFTNVEHAKQTIREIEEAEALSEKMSKKVNKKSTVMYEGIKKEYEELLEKRSTLDEDRQAIIEVITQVEARKWTSLDRMVTTVSNVFSTLFSACLPGATAKLVEERNDHGHICGLQVKVSFNGKEKESLTELSGGQRSLLALCLILAILRLKPAPIYILDEVDAALDPSHTQNIGRMLQQHFSNSQFLLVSLKDGMFNNANVLFEIRNTQGFSEITRKEAK